MLGELFDYAGQLGLSRARVDLKGCTALDDVVESLVTDLGEGVLPGASRTSGPARSFRLLADLQALRTPLLLVFDSYERASDNTCKWIETHLLLRLETLPALVVCLAGQTVPEPRNHAWGRWAKRICLGSIREVNHWVQFARRKWGTSAPTKSAVKELTQAVGGVPARVTDLLDGHVANQPLFRTS